MATEFNKTFSDWNDSRNIGLLAVQPPHAAASPRQFLSVKVLFSGKINFILSDC